jgi:hypothetical protein
VVTAVAIGTWPGPPAAEPKSAPMIGVNIARLVVTAVAIGTWPGPPAAESKSAPMIGMNIARPRGDGCRDRHLAGAAHCGVEVGADDRREYCPPRCDGCRDRHLAGAARCGVEVGADDRREHCPPRCDGCRDHPTSSDRRNSAAGPLRRPAIAIYIL